MNNNIFIKSNNKDVVVYRGWMLKQKEYAKLCENIEFLGSSMFTSLDQYIASHYLPNWYHLIPELTPETKIFSKGVNLKNELERLGWDAFFIKDYVKSVKNGSIITNPDEADRVLAEIEEHRGEIEGGICVRKFEKFLDNTEKRYFVINGYPYGSDPEEKVPSVVRDCSKIIPSPFFSVDVVKRCDGVERIVEVGDGQVSDLVGWNAGHFAEIWKTI
jgi:hypothetical protein